MRARGKHDIQMPCRCLETGYQPGIKIAHPMAKQNYKNKVQLEKGKSESGK